jgi:hypothetical protein
MKKIYIHRLVIIINIITFSYFMYLFNPDFNEKEFILLEDINTVMFSIFFYMLMWTVIYIISTMKLKSKLKSILSIILMIGFYGVSFQIIKINVKYNAVLGFIIMFLTCQYYLVMRLIFSHKER